MKISRGDYVQISSDATPPTGEPWKTEYTRLMESGAVGVVRNIRGAKLDHATYTVYFLQLDSDHKAKDGSISFLFEREEIEPANVDLMSQIETMKSQVVAQAKYHFDGTDPMRYYFIKAVNEPLSK